MASRNQQQIDQYKRDDAADAVKTMGTKWLIIDGDEYKRKTYATDEVVKFTVAVPQMEWSLGAAILTPEEHTAEIAVRVNGRMLMLNHERDNMFGFTGVFDYQVPGMEFHTFVPCIGFYNVPGRCGELTIFKY